MTYEEELLFVRIDTLIVKCQMDTISCLNGEITHEELEDRRKARTAYILVMAKGGENHETEPKPTQTK